MGPISSSKVLVRESCRGLPRPVLASLLSKFSCPYFLSLVSLMFRRWAFPRHSSVKLQRSEMHMWASWKRIQGDLSGSLVPGYRDISCLGQMRIPFGPAHGSRVDKGIHLRQKISDLVLPHVSVFETLDVEHSYFSY